MSRYAAGDVTVPAIKPVTDAFDEWCNQVIFWLCGQFGVKTVILRQRHDNSHMSPKAAAFNARNGGITLTLFGDGALRPLDIIPRRPTHNAVDSLYRQLEVSWDMWEGKNPPAKNHRGSAGTLPDIPEWLRRRHDVGRAVLHNTIADEAHAGCLYETRIESDHLVVVIWRDGMRTECVCYPRRDAFGGIEILGKFQEYLNDEISTHAAELGLETRPNIQGDTDDPSGNRGEPPDLSLSGKNGGARAAEFPSWITAEERPWFVWFVGLGDVRVGFEIDKMYGRIRAFLTECGHPDPKKRAMAFYMKLKNRGIIQPLAGETRGGPQRCLVKWREAEVVTKFDSSSGSSGVLSDDVANEGNETQEGHSVRQDEGRREPNDARPEDEAGSAGLAGDPPVYEESREEGQSDGQEAENHLGSTEAPAAEVLDLPTSQVDLEGLTMEGLCTVPEASESEGRRVEVPEKEHPKLYRHEPLSTMLELEEFLENIDTEDICACIALAVRILRKRRFREVTLTPDGEIHLCWMRNGSSD